eukprot:scaffold1512_cov192-Alexandrium_tamarense.AAC.29
MDTGSPPSTFHTPDGGSTGSAPPTPFSSATAAASDLTASLNSINNNTSGYNNTNNDAEANRDEEEQTGILSSLLGSITPWRRKKRKSSSAASGLRSSLDGMSGSAIKNIHSTPHGMGEQEGGGMGGATVAGRVGGGSLGGGVARKEEEVSGSRLEKLNLEKKFDGSSPKVQTLRTAERGGQSYEDDGEGGMGARKRVRLGNNYGVGSNNASVAVAGRKSVTIGGTTSCSSPYAAYAGGNNATPNSNRRTGVTFAVNGGEGGGNTFQAGATPGFHIGSAGKSPATTTNLRDIRGRRATPARRSIGMASATTTAATHNNTALGMRNTAQRQLTSRPKSTLSRTGYRRCRINGTYRPMSRLLTSTFSSGVQQSKLQTEAQKKQSLLLTQSMASQILAENRARLFGESGGSGGELTLFGGGGVGGASGENGALGRQGVARTFEEEAAAYKAVTGNPVPRVRMNRVLGSGQTGGSRVVVQQQPAVTAAAPVAATQQQQAGTTTFALGGMSATATTQPPPPAFSMTSSALSGIKRKEPTVSKPSVAPFPTPKKADAFQSARQSSVSFATKSDVAMGETETESSTEFVPYTIPTTPARGDILPLNNVSDTISKEEGEALLAETKTPEFKKKSKEVDFGFASCGTPSKKRAKATATPHPKKAQTSTAPSTFAAPSPSLNASSSSKSAAPFSFMPGGASASSKVSTPSAFKFQSSTESSSSKPATLEKSTPSKSAMKALQKDSSSNSNEKAPSQRDSTSASVPAASGWGDLFAAKPGEWKCSTCSAKNPKEMDKCPCCETPKGDGDFSSGDKLKALTSTTAAATATTTPATSGWGNMFAAKPGEWKCSTCSTKNPKEMDKCPCCETPKGEGGGDKTNENSAPKSKRCREGDASKAGIGSGGFSFGGSTASTSSSTPSASMGSGGFSFGAAPNKPTAPPAGFTFGGSSSKSEEKKEEAKEQSTAKPPNSLGSTFGGKPSASEDKTDTSASGGFSFGSASSAKKEEPKSSQPSFTFVSTSTASEKKDSAASSTQGFTFGGANIVKKEEPKASQPSFSFGSTPAASEKKELAASSTPGFSFGGSSSAKKEEPKAPQPSFSFGSTPAASEKKEPAASTPAFTFGSTPSAGPSTASRPFAFSTPATEKKEPVPPASTPAFSFGASTSASAPSNASFTFGATGQTSSATSGFAPPQASGTSFGSTPAQPSAPQPSFGSTPAQSAAPQPSFGFGAASQTPATPSMGGFAPATAPQPSGMSFGPAPAQTSAPPSFGSTPMSFGSTPMPSASTPAVPSFGGGGFGSAVQTPAAATPGGFSIGTADTSKKSTGRRIIKARRPGGGR